MKKGDVIEIKGQTISGKPCIEGKAELVKPMTPHGFKDGQMWEVHFLKDHPGETFYRWIPESLVPKPMEESKRSSQ